MVLGVGTDILLIDRIRRVSFEASDAFMLRTFTKKERDQAIRRDDPTLYFATRFSGKEAVFKALCTDAKTVKSLNQIEILSDDAGRPYVTLHDDVKKLAEQRGIDEMFISLSFDTEYATAFAVAQSESENKFEF